MGIESDMMATGNIMASNGRDENFNMFAEITGDSPEGPCQTWLGNPRTKLGGLSM